MGVRIVHNSREAVLYCSTTDWAFGPVFSGDDEHSAEERAQAFLHWLPKDARKYDNEELERQYIMWRAQEDEQWRKEE